MGSSDKIINHRAFVGPEDRFDIVGAHQLSILIKHGLRESHTLLDIGCGSLRGGRFLIVYLNSGNYHGVEPNEGILNAGLESEIPNYKNSQFHITDDFSFPDRQFDFLLAHSIFIHASEKQVAKCIAQASRVMHSGSKFLATYFIGDKTPAKEDWSYPSPIHHPFKLFKQEAIKSNLGISELSDKHPTHGHIWLLLTKA